MAISKVVYGGNTLVDLTGDTVKPEVLSKGYTAHGADGEPIVGTMDAGAGGGGGDNSIEDAIITRTLSGEYTNDRVTSIGLSALSSCANLTSVFFPNVTSIGQSAFGASGNIKKAVFPKATTIGYSAFSNLTNAVLDFKELSSFAGTELRYCSSMHLVLRKTDGIVTLTQSWGAVGFAGIYVPSELVDTYKTATNWSSQSNYFKPLENYTVDGTIDGEFDKSKV